MTIFSDSSATFAKLHTVASTTETTQAGITLLLLVCNTYVWVLQYSSRNRAQPVCFESHIQRRTDREVAKKLTWLKTENVCSKCAPTTRCASWTFFPPQTFAKVQLVQRFHFVESHCNVTHLSIDMTAGRSLDDASCLDASSNSSAYCAPVKKATVPSYKALVRSGWKVATSRPTRDSSGQRSLTDLCIVSADLPVLDILVKAGIELPTDHNQVVCNLRLERPTGLTRRCRDRKFYQTKWEGPNGRGCKEGVCDSLSYLFRELSKYTANSEECRLFKAVHSLGGWWVYPPKKTKQQAKTETWKPKLKRETLRISRVLIKFSMSSSAQT